MARVSRRAVVAGLGLAALGLGCGGMNPFLIPYMFSGGESKTPAEFPLVAHGKNKDAKVVVFVSHKVGLHPDLVGVERMLNAELIQILDARVKENDEKVLILKMPRIDEYKAQNPNWKSAHPCDIGRTVAENTDYVIDVEIAEMDLYKPGSRGQWLQGHAIVHVNVYDLTKPLKDPVYKIELPIRYPQNGYEYEVESKAHVSSFRMAFVQRIASDISVKFAATSPQRRVDGMSIR
jgi:hypothetical protein